MANNRVTFDLELALGDFQKGLNSANQKLGSFHKDFDKRVKTSNSAFASFVGNLGAQAFAGAVRGLGSIVSGLVDVSIESANAAIDAEETKSKFEAVFSSISVSANQMGAELARSYGLGTVESKKLLGNTGDLLTGFGFAQREALDLSNSVQELAVDLASFTNFAGGAAGASDAITKALLGERESVKALGVSLQEADVQRKIQENRALGITFATDRQAKAQATLDLIMEQSKNAIGDYGRTADGVANQQKLFNTRIQDLSENLGTALIPALKVGYGELNKFMASLDVEPLKAFITNGIIELIGYSQRLVEYINPVVSSFKFLYAVGEVALTGLVTGFNILETVISGVLGGIVGGLNSLISSLPASLVPEEWTSNLALLEEAFDATTDHFAEKALESSELTNEAFGSVAESFKNTVSEENLELISERLEKFKEKVRSASADMVKTNDKSNTQMLKDDKKATSKNSKLWDEFYKDWKGYIVGFKSFEESTNQQRIANMKGTLGTISTLTSQNNSTLFAIGKAAAIANATIDGISAVQKALASAPPPFNFVLAALVGVATAANISKIASAKPPAKSAGSFASGGIVGGTSYIGDRLSANVNSGEMILNRQQQNNLFNQANGSGGNNEALIAEVRALRQEIANRPVVIYADDNEIARSASRGSQNGVEIGRSR